MVSRKTFFNISPKVFGAGGGGGREGSISAFNQGDRSGPGRGEGAERGRGAKEGVGGLRGPRN